MDQKTLFTHLKQLGSCNFCCLRYLNGRSDEYLNVEEALKKRGIEVRKPEIDKKTEDITAENPTKKLKEDVCTICLGIFEQTILDEIMEKINETGELAHYKTQKANCAVSIPIFFQVRQLAVWLKLLKAFPGSFNEDDPPDQTIKEAFRSVVNHFVCNNSNKYSDPKGLLIGVNLTLPNEDDELLKLKKVKPELFREREKFAKYRDFMTRTAFEQHFSPKTINVDLFIEAFPLDAPMEKLTLASVTVTGNTIFVAGRYQKFSRKLSQTPWILGGKRVIENSVQEFITMELAKFFKVNMDQMIFMASGREDVDVRCLGKGRPFIVEIPDAKINELKSDEAVEIENAVNESKQIRIRDLQVVSRESTMYLKKGEEDKKKLYRALCVMKRAVTEEDLEKLNKPDGFEISQPTPLRVLHRRPLHDRPRTIYNMKAEKYEGLKNALVLEVETQAGTYVKELVHGELGRTKPSVQSILGEFIDLVALDVVAVDLDWPKEIERL